MKDKKNEETSSLESRRRRFRRGGRIARRCHEQRGGPRGGHGKVHGGGSGHGQHGFSIVSRRRTSLCTKHRLVRETFDA